MRTITIELRYDVDDDSKHELLRDAAIAAAKHLHATAVLLGEKRTPHVVLHSEDFFAGREEISLADDIPGNYLSAPSE